VSDDTPAERGWLWRRSYTYAATAINLLFVGLIVWKVDDPDALTWVAIALIASNIIMAGLYLAGASVLDYAKLAGAWKSGKSEETMVETSAGTVTQTTTETKPAEFER
jgi:hypothetical protein